MNLEFIDLYPMCIITTKVPTSSAELLKIKIFKYRLYSRPHIEKWSYNDKQFKPNDTTAWDK